MSLFGIEVDMTAALIATVLASMAVMLICKRISAHHSNRIRYEALARKLLQRHFVAANAIIDDPAVPEHIKEFVMALSRVIGRSAHAGSFARKLTAGKQLEASEEPEVTDKTRKAADEIISEVRNLRQHRPDLADQFDELLVRGIDAMVLRFGPEKYAEFIYASESDVVVHKQRQENARKYVHTVVSEVNAKELCVAA